MRVSANVELGVPLQECTSLLEEFDEEAECYSLTVDDTRLALTVEPGDSFHIFVSAKVTSQEQFDTACLRLEEVVREHMPRCVPVDGFYFADTRAYVTTPLTPEVVDAMWIRTHPALTAADQPLVWRLRADVSDMMISIAWHVESVAPASYITQEAMLDHDLANEGLLAHYDRVGDPVLRVWCDFMFGCGVTENDIVTRCHEIIAQFA